MTDYYFPDENRDILDEIMLKFVRIGFENWSIMQLGAGSMLSIWFSVPYLDHNGTFIDR